MNEAYQTVITASDEERRDLFLGTAARLGTAVQNVEKDFWVCWTLDALFNGLEPGGPRLLFKGGTSLSKAFGLISRFSEDIDITVFREDLRQYVDVAELEAMSGKKRRARLDEITSSSFFMPMPTGLHNRVPEFRRRSPAGSGRHEDQRGRPQSLPPCASAGLWCPSR